MTTQTPDFSLAVAGMRGLCPGSEAYALKNLAEGKIPVLSREGPCIRGEIARLAANLVAQEAPGCARACHAETFLVPHSAMAQWVRQADWCLRIDGCFPRCHGRVLNKLVGDASVVQIDALPLHRKFSDVFLMDDVPEQERKAVTRQVADKILAKLAEEGPPQPGGHLGSDSCAGARPCGSNAETGRR